MRTYANFFSLGRQNYSKILSDDYSHKNVEQENIKGTTTNGNGFSYNQKMNMKTDPNTKKNQITITDELKLGFEICNHFYILGRFKRNGEIKHIYDFGNYTILGQVVNLYANTKFNKGFTQRWFRFGLEHKKNNFETNNRVEKDYEGNFSLSSKLSLTKGPILFKCCSILNLTSQALTRYDALLNYAVNNKLDVTLQHWSPKTDQIQLGKVLAAIAYKVNEKLSVALQAKQNFVEPKQRAVVGIQYATCKNSQVKAKVDSKGKVSLATKFTCSPKFTCSIGTQLNLQNGANFINFKNIIPLPFGYTLDWNV